MNKKSIIFLISIALIAIFVNTTYSCEITIKSDKNVYKINETAVITVILRQTHGNCAREGNSPSYKLSGLSLIHKSAFTKISDDQWKIEYKVKVLKRDASFISYRRCPRGGDEITFNLKVIR